MEQYLLEVWQRIAQIYREIPFRFINLPHLKCRTYLIRFSGTFHWIFCQESNGNRVVTQLFFSFSFCQMELRHTGIFSARWICCCDVFTGKWLRFPLGLEECWYSHLIISSHPRCPLYAAVATPKLCSLSFHGAAAALPFKWLIQDRSQKNLTDSFLFFCHWVIKTWHNLFMFF